ncbi:ATP-binding cassette domain-containing protein [Photobacterium nomapromontoriensis]|uniref:ATP-binding cassette domain-containing protein n=1 Tax=Photobacterium nomapromontoriensis TaxID=2910237 RepID=UPI003D0FF2E8
MLSVNQLSITANFGDGQLLKPLSFDLQRGEILGVIGESGSGKSLLAHAMLGHVPKGYRIKGHITASASVALSAQSAAVFDPLRTISQHLSRWRRAFVHQDHYLEQLGIDQNIASSYRHQLSGGMAKRACLAQAIVQNPHFLLADEPCAGLDDDAAHHTYQRLRQKTDNDHLGMMIISHNLRQLMKWSDRILVLKQGELIELTTPNAIRDNQCHTYSRSLWEALPENWETLNAEFA